jgi:hypothetical protein
MRGWLAAAESTPTEIMRPSILLYNPWARRKGMGDLTNPKVKKIERN